MQLYDKIVNLASARNLTIKELEFRAGFANGTIRRWNFSDPGISRVQTVANILGVDIGSIIYDFSQLNLNQRRLILYKDKSLRPPNYNDAHFGISDNIRGYDKVRYNYTFKTDKGDTITPQSIFIFEDLDNFKTFYFGMLNVDSTYLIKRRENTQQELYAYYIVKVKTIMYPDNTTHFIGESLDPEAPLIPLHNGNVEILSQCINVIHPVY